MSLKRKVYGKNKAPFFVIVLHSEGEEITIKSLTSVRVLVFLNSITAVIEFKNLNELTTYKRFFQDVIDTINNAKYEAFKSVNKFHIGQNFEIGKLIVQNQEKNNWGKSIVDTLSKDINQVIDGVKGYSPQNLWRMRQFYLEYKDQPELLNLTLKIPWGQNLLVLHKIKDKSEKEYYLTAIDKLAWSRAVLLNQIKAEAYNRYHIAKPLPPKTIPNQNDSIN